MHGFRFYVFQCFALCLYFVFLLEIWAESSFHVVGRSGTGVLVLRNVSERGILDPKGDEQEQSKSHDLVGWERPRPSDLGRPCSMHVHLCAMTGWAKPVAAPLRPTCQEAGGLLPQILCFGPPGTFGKIGTPAHLAKLSAHKSDAGEDRCFGG